MASFDLGTDPFLCHPAIRGGGRGWVLEWRDGAEKGWPLLWQIQKTEEMKQFRSRAKDFATITSCLFPLRSLRLLHLD